MGYKGRFAPSPTGPLHLGSVATALFAAAATRRAGGQLVLRVEDLDRPRVLADSEASQLADLEWLGVRFDEGPHLSGPSAPYRQSERQALYVEALEVLSRAGHTYLCDCSRAEIARAASAPHEGEEGPRYPGTCRPFGMTARAFRRPPAVRLAIPEGSEVTVHDVRDGVFAADPASGAGDFVLRRGDGVFAYQLAVVVDDLTMGITDVVRGADLASSAARQALLFQLLGGCGPRFLHIPLLVESSTGERLAKRTGLRTVTEQRRLGASSREILAAIARAYGHATRPSDESVIDHVAETFDPRKFPRSVVSIEDVEVAA